MLLFILIFIFISLSVDCFIVMMKKGAQIKDLTFKKINVYAIIFAITSLTAIFVGYLLANLFRQTPIAFLNEVCAVLILFGLGITFILKAIFNTNFKETLDNSFTNSKCLSLAFLTNIDTLLVGVSMSLLDIRLSIQALLSAICSFVSVLIALKVGYNYGLKFNRIIQISGGVLLIIFAIFVACEFVVVG